MCEKALCLVRESPAPLRVARTREDLSETVPETLSWILRVAPRAPRDDDKAVRLLRMLNPVERARDEEDCERYKVEPYVLPGDVYSLAGHIGRGRLDLSRLARRNSGIPTPRRDAHNQPGHTERLAWLPSAIPFPKHHLSHWSRESRPLFPRCHPGGIGWNRGSRQNHGAA
jgi:hypothetical protein